MFAVAGVSTSMSHSPERSKDTVVTFRYAPPQSYAMIADAPESNVASMKMLKTLKIEMIFKYKCVNNIFVRVVCVTINESVCVCMSMLN